MLIYRLSWLCSLASDPGVAFAALSARWFVPLSYGVVCFDYAQPVIVPAVLRFFLPVLFSVRCGRRELRLLLWNVVGYG